MNGCSRKFSYCSCRRAASVRSVRRGVASAAPSRLVCSCVSLILIRFWLVLDVFQLPRGVFSLLSPSFREQCRSSSLVSVRFRPLRYGSSFSAVFCSRDQSLSAWSCSIEWFIVFFRCSSPRLAVFGLFSSASVRSSSFPYWFLSMHSSNVPDWWLFTIVKSNFDSCSCSASSVLWPARLLFPPSLLFLLQGSFLLV